MQSKNSYYRLGEILKKDTIECSSFFLSPKKKIKEIREI